MFDQDEIFKYDKNKILEITDKMHTNSERINKFFSVNNNGYGDKKETIKHKLQLIKDISDEIIKKKK